MDKSNGFSLGGEDCTRGPARRSDVARSSERAGVQELRIHGDETQGGSQGSRADAGAAAERRHTYDNATLLPRTGSADSPGEKPRGRVRVEFRVLTHYAQGRPRV